MDCNTIPRLPARSLLLSITLLIAACGGDNGLPYNFSDWRLSTSEIFVQPYETQAVEISYASNFTPATMFSEKLHHVDITTRGCAQASASCVSWDNTPLVEALPGTHRVSIGDLASADQWGRIYVGADYDVNNIPPSLLGKSAASALSSSSFARSIYVQGADASLSGWGYGVTSDGQPDLTALQDFTSTLPRDMWFGNLDIQRVVPGYAHTIIIDSDGGLYSMGINNHGQLGAGEMERRDKPVQVNNISNVSAVDLGLNFTLAISNGQVWSWGGNEAGQLGDGNTTDRFEPVQVADLAAVSAVAAGGSFSLALRQSDQSVWAWGSNQYFQLAQAVILDSSLPLQVSGLPAISAIAAGENHAIALASDGSVWGWGRNEYHQAGVADSPVITTATQISGLSACTAIAAGAQFSMALCAGDVYTWGLVPELEDRRTPSSAQAVARVTGLSNVSAISAGEGFASVIRDDCSTGGSVWSWGVRSQSARGSNATGNLQGVPAPVIGFADSGNCSSKRVWIYKLGDGDGTLSSDSGNLDCDAFYCWVDIPASSTSVTLSAEADAQSLVDGWYWDCAAAGSANSVTLDLSSSHLCKIVFAARPDQIEFTLSLAIDGQGSVTSNPAGIDCGGSCSASFTMGSAVILSAQPGPGQVFQGFTGACSDGTVVMNSDYQCSAIFSPSPAQGVTLSITKSGGGFGLVHGATSLQGSALVIDCGSDCVETVSAGTTVYLQPLAYEGYFFSHWSGCDAVETVNNIPQCLVTLNADRSIDASFE